VWGSVTDPDVVDKTVREQDLAYHLAANIHVDESIAFPAKYYRTNVLGTLNVVEACRLRRVPLIHASTCEVYGGCERCQVTFACRQAIRETCPLKPQSPYAASKAGGELLALAHAATYGQRVLIVRPGNVFGPGQRFGGRGAVIPIFLRAAVRNEPIRIFGDGRQTRDFVYVADLVAAYLHLRDAFLAGRTPPVVNAGSGTPVTIEHVARAIVEQTGSRSVILYVDGRPGEVRGFRLDNAAIERLGFRPGWSFDAGLRATVEWFRATESDDKEVA
jgi:nucleoside-diphosphate-sugar epimerase